MGVDKAFVRWRGTRLIDHQIATLRRTGPVELLISGRHGVTYAVPDVGVVLDATLDCGPLGGIAAILAMTRASHVIVLAVDMPEISPQFLLRLVAHSRHGTGAIVRTDFGWEPLAAVYPRELLPLVEARIVRRERALQPWIDAAVAANLMRAMPLSAVDAAMFTNLNRPTDLLK